MSSCLFAIVGTLAFVLVKSSTEIIPERTQLDYINDKFLKNVLLSVKRYSRRSPYYYNVEGTVLHSLGDKVSLHSVFFEFLHNEYKRSFVEIHTSLCDLFHKYPWKDLIGTVLIAKGASCPIPPGTYRLHNLTASLSNIPYVWPFEKAMLQIHGTFIPTQEVIGRARFYGTFKREFPKQK